MTAECHQVEPMILIGSCSKKNKQNPCKQHNNNWGNLNMDENITISVLIFLGVIMVCVP